MMPGLSPRAEIVIADQDRVIVGDLGGDADDHWSETPHLGSSSVSFEHIEEDAEGNRQGSIFYRIIF